MNPARLANLVTGVLLFLLAPVTLGDTQERFEHAIDLTRAGDHRSALTGISALYDEFPDNVDYVFARAQILARLDRIAEALRELEIAVRLAPDYEAVWRLRLSLLKRDEGSASTIDVESVRAEAARRFPEATWWRETGINDGGGDWELLVGGTHDELSGNRPGWNRQFTQARYERTNRAGYFVGVARDERFRNVDVTLQLGGDWRVGDAWLAGVKLATANDPAFQSRFEVGANAGRMLNNGWVANLRYRYRNYPTTNARSLAASVEKYIGDYRVAYALGLSRLSGSSPVVGHGLGADRYFSEALSLGVRINAGREAEAIDAGRVLETDVRGIVLRGRLQFSHRVGLRWWLGWHDQGDFYERRYLGLAVSLRL